MSDNEAKSEPTWLDSEEAAELFGASLPAVRKIADAAKRGPEGGETWLTTGETAEVLGLSISQVRRLADSGALVFRWNRAGEEPGEDRHGHKLQGHRRVSLTSAMTVKFVREHGLPDPSSDTLDT
jgi:hypothetical protein